MNPDLSDSEKLTYCHLCIESRLQDRRTNVVHLPEFAAKYGISIHALRKRLNKLDDLNYIIVTNRSSAIWHVVDLVPIHEAYYIKEQIKNL